MTDYILKLEEKNQYRPEDLTLGLEFDRGAWGELLLYKAELESGTLAGLADYCGWAERLVERAIAEGNEVVLERSADGKAKLAVKVEFDEVGAEQLCPDVITLTAGSLTDLIQHWEWTDKFTEKAEKEMLEWYEAEKLERRIDAWESRREREHWHW